MDPAAALAEMDELVEEVLLRSPPDDPAHLVRAALVCKRWCRILADAGFRRRFRKLHRTPPMLGILHRHTHASYVTTFTATSSFRPRNGDLLRDWCALDSRHGRVLLAGLPLRDDPSENNLSVWDPVTGEQLELPEQPQHPNRVPFGWNATVLCPDGACDHLDCGRGPFLVVVVGTDFDGGFVYAYSSEAGAWRDPTYAAHYGGDPLNFFFFDPCAYVENALYFMFHRDMKPGILEYNLGTHEISQDLLPHYLDRGVLTTTENGGLGFAAVDWSRLYLWSREAGRDGYPIWAQSRTIELNTMFPADCPLLSSCMIGSVHGLHVFFVSTVDGIFSIDLKSGRMRKVCKERDIENFVSYMSFCTPALGEIFTVEGPSAGVSSA
ncbi:hypothetical protein SEVIR_2G021100v4 [Setaria viridis]|uniref:F-box domain-containing protein n=1 Tax=Setaria viridis TaxID=4556 RepID=A0A4U6VNE3_SETVI|nr:uncharacterized protein LOC117842261 isoform X1 [Setaria viridis]XP_034578539.1 uncharacterized protein LOC117842261 isoform X1 [Setaria viridis]XP_034578540.1 uncharacterized protein LOC117842261 isoform X1 [Setaria viridis]XP_034578541.1 uncharacterized protein LOC117842261 isoform X1 [Setaria viridis]TKW30214.1 hypothetical protein SEVIR_2G021100v2 [Setaria viridis]